MDQFAYRALYRLDNPDQLATIFAWRNPIGSPLEAVMWHGARSQWVFAPEVLRTVIFVDENTLERVERIDRTTAARICQETLGTDLPSEAELDRICRAKTPAWDDPHPQT